MRRATILVCAGVASAGVVACSLFIPFDDYERGSAHDAGSPDASDASTCDADLEKDGLHCGACDHSCLGRGCAAGLCGIDTVFTATASLYAAGLALDDDAAYLACGTSVVGAEGALLRVGKKDLATAPIASMGAAPFRVVATAGELLFTQGGLVDAGAPSSGIGRTPKTPAASPPFVAPFVANQSGPYALALDGESVFFTNFLFGGGDVWRASLSGAPQEHSIAAAQGAAAVAVDASFVYWTDSLPVGTVMRAAKDGTGSVPIAQNQSVPFAIFVDDDSVYWTGFSAGGSVMRLAKAGGAPVALASGQDHPNAVVADAAYVYWSNAGPVGATNAGTVSRVPKGGGDAVVLAVLAAPSDLAVDADHVYWASQGSVFRVPK